MFREFYKNSIFELKNLNILKEMIEGVKNKRFLDLQKFLAGASGFFKFKFQNSVHLKFLRNEKDMKKQL